MLKPITPPVGEPITLDEVKAFLRVDGNEENTYLENIIIPASRIVAEAMTRRALMTQVWELYMDKFPWWTWLIPMPPLQSVEFIRYLDDAGEEKELDESLYLTDLVSSPARITPLSGNVWPTTYAANNAVWIRFTCGYGSADQVPVPIKQWMLMRCASLFEQREPMTLDTASRLTTLPHNFVDGLLDPYRIIGFY